MTTLRKNSPKRKLLLARCEMLRQDLCYHAQINNGQTATTQEAELQGIILEALAELNELEKIL